MSQKIKHFNLFMLCFSSFKFFITGDKSKITLEIK